MTRLLEHAFEQASQLPNDAQDALAQRILDELQDAQAWDQSFARTRDDQWDKIAEQVRRERAAGTTAPIDELIK